jgi:ABC-type transport system involved in multi-copper enzyme maturation permease subunit
MKLFPWTGFLYELRRGLLSVPLIVITALIIVASTGILVSIEESHPPPSNIMQTSGAYYYANGAYHFEVFAYDEYGRPISGVSVNLTVFQTNATFGPPGPSIANASGVSGRSGIVQLTAPVNDSNSWVEVFAYAPGWSTFGAGQLNLVMAPPAPGVVEPFLRGFTSTVESSPGIKQSNLLEIFYPGPNGTAPDYQVYWAYPQNETYPPAVLGEDEMHRLGALTSADQTFNLVVPSTPSSTNPNAYLQVELFTAKGTLVATDTNQSASNFFPPPGGAAGAALALGFAGTIMVFLVPLMAILATYSVYGKDRLTGVLEGVLARPVSRLGIAASRYLAVIVALTIAVTLALVCLDALIDWVYDGFLPWLVTLILFCALLVEVAAFTSLTFLLSHALRSTGALVGVGIGLFALFTIGWLIIPNILGGLTGTIFTPGYEATILRLQFFDPVQFIGLCEDVYFASVSAGFFGGSTSPATYGITLGSVIATGIAWTVAPAVALFYVVQHHD